MGLFVVLNIIRGFAISLVAHALIIAVVSMPLLRVHRSEVVAPVLENSGLTFTIAELPPPQPVKTEVSKPVVKAAPKPQLQVKPVALPSPVEKAPIPVPVVEELPVIEETTIAEKQPVVEKPVRELPEVKPIIVEKKVVEKPAPVVVEEIVEVAPKAEKNSARIEKPAMPSEPISVNYPRRARRAGLEGDVTLSVLVGVDGVVKAVTILSGTGHEELDNAAEKAIFRARFIPASLDGVAVDASVVQVISFRLKE